MVNPPQIPADLAVAYGVSEKGGKRFTVYDAARIEKAEKI
jgi:hypothetical protein